MAISQHQFYLDRKQSKAKIPSARSMDSIAMELTEAGTKVSKMVEGKNPLIMASNGSLISSGSQDSEVSQDHKVEKIQELKKKEKALQEVLLKKIEELKKICLREAEITGKLPEEYPLNPGEKLPTIRRRMGTAFNFKLDDHILLNEEDPELQNLERNFLIQQQMVEATKKLATEPDLSKNVKRKRKQEYSDAIKKLQDLESTINEYRVKSGRDPTKRASLLMQDDIIPSESSSLSETTLDDDESVIFQGQRPSPAHNSPKGRPPKGGEKNLSRKSSLNEQLLDMRLSSHREPSSTHSSPYKTSERKSHGGRSMPSTPVLTRNAYSSNHLQNEGVSGYTMQRRGSLESHTPLLSDTVDAKATFTISKNQRSNSTEILDDGSSYTSQSSSECYSTPPKQNPCYTTQTLDNRSRDRRRHRKQNFLAASSGSMPNLAHKDARNSVYQMTQNQPSSSSFYIMGYSGYPDSDPYYNGGYIYENDTEGQYTVNPSYHSSTSYGYESYRDGRYGTNQFVPQNPYATLRLPRKKNTEQITKNIKKAIVAEHLRGWYQRASSHKDVVPGIQGMVDCNRGSQRSLCYASMQVPSSPSSRAPSCSSVSSTSTQGVRRAQPNNLGYPDYTAVPQTSYTGYTTAYSTNTLPSRSYFTYPSQLDDTNAIPLNDDLPNDQELFWHEDAKPGTLV